MNNTNEVQTLTIQLNTYFQICIPNILRYTLFQQTFNLLISVSDISKPPVKTVKVNDSNKLNRGNSSTYLVCTGGSKGGSGGHGSPKQGSVMLQHSFVNCKLTSLTSFFCCDHHNNKRRLRFNTVLLWLTPTFLPDTFWLQGCGRWVHALIVYPSIVFSWIQVAITCFF